MDYRSAVITGASSGIGEAFARALPRATSLLLTGRDRDRLARLAQDLAGGDRQVRTVVADLSDSDGRRAVIAAAEAAEVDLLINNAGLGRLGRVIDNAETAEAEMVQVNIAAPVEITRALLPGMLRRAESIPQGSGARRAGIVNVASAAAFSPMPFFATYAATKTFLLHYSEALAEELADRPVDVLALCPGATQSRFFERAGIENAAFTSVHESERVAREALNALGHRRVHVVGPGNYLATAAMRLLPHRLTAAAASTLMQRWK